MSSHVVGTRLLSHCARLAECIGTCGCVKLRMLCRGVDPGPGQQHQHKQRPVSTGEKRDALQHMHFNSLFNVAGMQDEDERVHHDSEKHCTSAQKLQHMPAAGGKLQQHPASLL